MKRGLDKIEVRAPDYQTFNQSVTVEANLEISVPTIKLKKALAQLSLQSSPQGAAVILNEQYLGITPMEVKLKPEVDHQLKLYKAGYTVTHESLLLKAAEQLSKSIKLDQDLIPVRISLSPSDAEIYVDGQFKGSGSQTINLSSLPHKISIRKKGYIEQNFDLVPVRGNEQLVSAKLLTKEQHYWAQLPDQYTNSYGHTMKLFKNLGVVEMGSSRREQGRRSNEIVYQAQLTKPFYVALHENSNKQFREFRRQHNSGNYKGKSLNASRVPVVNISWQDAARYCNWLSKQEGLDPFYRTVKGFIADFNEGANGYRLLSEVEWSWLARNTDSGPMIYPWGSEQSPGDQKVGNFADDRTVNIITFRLEGYDDGYAGPSPVGKFAKNHRGIFDLEGNVSEWVNDWYSPLGNSNIK